MPDSTRRPALSKDFVIPKVGDSPVAVVPRRRIREPRRLDWRRGGPATRRWDVLVLAAATMGAGAGVIGSAIAVRIFGAGFPNASLTALWAGLIASILFALVRARPEGLFAIKLQDLLWCIPLAVTLRLVQGWLSDANNTSFPAAPSTNGVIEASWFLQFALPSGVIGPAIEETFFRGLVLVGVYQALRRTTGAVAAGLTAVAFSCAAFVLIHSLQGPLQFNDGLQFGLLAVTCALAVLMTGRMWPAFIIHATYNVTFLLIMVLGATLS